MLFNVLLSFSQGLADIPPLDARHHRTGSTQDDINYLMVPQSRIERLSDDYKSTVLPLYYKGMNGSGSGN